MIPEGYIATYTGRLINPLDPDPEQISALDIAHHLSNLCRFTGAVRRFYSIGQHSCYVSDIVSKENKLWGLLHDASEFALADLAAPVKNAQDMNFYKVAEKRLMNAICYRFNLPFEEPEEIYWADKTLLNMEQRDLMPPETYYVNGYKPLEWNITPWRQEIAKSATIERLEKLGIEVKR